MSALFAWLWIVGGAPPAVLGEVVRADSPRIARAGRIAFALLLGADLLVAAVVLSVGAESATTHMTRSLWWFTVALAGVPLALVSGLAVWRGYAGHRHALVVATLTTAALYLAFPLGFTPATQPRLTGSAASNTTTARSASPSS
jgi:cytochrome bd-type quinol oxidase subunit 2